MPDSSDIDAALVGLLSGDATLMALSPGGVYVDIAPSGKTKFVIVSLVIEQDEPMFGERAYEDAVYLVKDDGFGVLNLEFQSRGFPEVVRQPEMVQRLRERN